MMKNCDALVKKNYNPNWSHILDHTNRILIIGGSGSCKTSVILNFMKYQQADIDKTYICQRSIQIKVSITYQWKRKSRN